jgi:hypothetical protein
MAHFGSRGIVQRHSDPVVSGLRYYLHRLAVVLVASASAGFASFPANAGDVVTVTVTGTIIGGNVGGTSHYYGDTYTLTTSFDADQLNAAATCNEDGGDGGSVLTSNDPSAATVTLSIQGAPAIAPYNSNISSDFDIDTSLGFQELNIDVNTSPAGITNSTIALASQTPLFPVGSCYIQNISITIPGGVLSAGTVMNGVFPDGSTFNFGGSIDTLTITQGTGASLTISSPTSSEIYPFNDSTIRIATVPYQASANASNDTVSWSISLSYTTSGGVGPFTGGDSFTSPLNMEVNRTYRGEGGQVMVNAAGAATGNAPSINYYISGASIPNSDITTRLIKLYQPTELPTQNLLAKIAVIESAGTYAQFQQTVLYGVAADWPIESGADGGAHIGLMQVPTSMGDAFDWYTNTNDGYQIFASKLKPVYRYIASAQDAIPGLPSLSGTQIEDSALSYYRGFALKYYLPKVINGLPTWVQNPRTRTFVSDGDTAAGYVAKVRGAAVPH